MMISFFATVATNILTVFAATMSNIPGYGMSLEELNAFDDISRLVHSLDQANTLCFMHFISFQEVAKNFPVNNYTGIYQKYDMIDHMTFIWQLIRDTLSHVPYHSCANTRYSCIVFL